MLPFPTLPKELISLRQRIVERRPSKMLSLLTETWTRGATDPKDKVFALIGLLKNSAEAGFKIDYSQSVENIYAEATTRITEDASSLEVLMFAVMPKVDDVVLPSLCPDWRACEPNTRLQRLWLHGRKNYLEWAAGGEMTRFVGSENIQVLSLEGAIVDVIQDAWPLESQYAEIWNCLEGMRQSLISLMVTAALPFLTAPSLKTPSGFNVLPMTNASVAYLEISLPDHVQSLQESLGSRGSKIFTADIFGTGCSAKQVTEDEISASYLGTSVEALFPGYFALSDWSISEGVVFTSSWNGDSNQTYESLARTFAVERRSCQATWNVTLIPLS
jgi:hypothetical protein